MSNGSASLGEGYELRNISYEFVGPSPDRHQFWFDLYGPGGLVQARVSYVGNHKSQWEDRKSAVSAGSSTLHFAVAESNDGKATLHYTWQ